MTLLGEKIYFYPMEKFQKLYTTAVPLPLEDVDTDQIIPARFLKAVERKGFGDNLFRDWRYNKDGSQKADFPLNNKKYSGKILVGAKNFGSGSRGSASPTRSQTRSFPARTTWWWTPTP